MKVIRSKTLGFCMGVRRAVEIARSAPFRAQGRVYTLGPLIHNPAVLADLEKRGVTAWKENGLPEAAALPGEEKPTVIIRAHGVSPAVEGAFVKQGWNVLDATCPHVKASQRKAAGFVERGYFVFLAGEQNHGEIVGIRGYVEAALKAAPGTAAAFTVPGCCVVGSPAEAEAAASGLAEAARRNPEAAVKTALVGQTTISPEEYRAIGGRIQRYFPRLEIQDTICGATADRQEALRELCGQVDAVIIAGGRASANTRRLLFLAGEMGKPSWLAESAGDLPPEISAYKTAGLCAGASTPDSLIDSIEDALAKL